KDIFEEVLHIPREELNEGVTFLDMGLDSISGGEVLRESNQHYRISLQGPMLYDNPTLDHLANIIEKEADWEDIKPSTHDVYLEGPEPLGEKMSLTTSQVVPDHLVVSCNNQNERFEPSTQSLSEQRHSDATTATTSSNASIQTIGR